MFALEKNTWRLYISTSDFACRGEDLLRCNNILLGQLCMRAITIFILLLFGTSTYASQIEFTFAPTNDFCNCAFIETEAGTESVWDLSGQTPPDSQYLPSSGSWSGGNNFNFGSFVYDQSTGVFSDIDLASSYAGFANYTEASASSSSALWADAESWYGGYQMDNELHMQFATPLDAVLDGDIVAVTVRVWTECTYFDGDCSISEAGVGTVYMVASSVVPIPAAAWLFGSALVGLGWLRRKQTV
jgi:hypothetical protein